jgi:hypothetical protein
MGRYRKIDPRIWNDEKFRDLSDNGKLCFFYILTHPHMTSLGAMRASIPGLASELGWVEKAFREAFQEGFRKAMLDLDESASFVGVPNFLKYNGPESPNVVKSWSVALDLIPECPSKNKLITQVKDFLKALPEAFQEALPKAFREVLPKGMPNKKQEPEQKKEPEKKTNRSASADPRYHPLLDFFFKNFKKERGHKFLPQEADFQGLKKLLKITFNQPEFDMELLQTAMQRFLASRDPFHLKQGKALAYFCGNINAFLGGARTADSVGASEESEANLLSESIRYLENENGLTEAQEKILERKRENLKQLKARNFIDANGNGHNPILAEGSR